MRILICSDGSKWAQKSAKFTLQLFRNTAHSITVLTFNQRTDEMDPARKSITRGTREKGDNIGADRAGGVIERELQDLVVELDVEEEEIEWLRDEGDMASHILSIADDYDLICLGGAGKGGFSQNMLGIIADEVILKGSGNLMVTKESGEVCRDVLVALEPGGLSSDLAHYLGKLFKGGPSGITIHVLWEDLPQRFEGYLDAATGQKMKRMVNEQFIEHDQEKARTVVDVIESYGVDCNFAYQDYKTLNQLVDNLEPQAYDLLIVHPASGGPDLIQQLEPGKQTLDLMRKSPVNVMLLRSLPGRDN